MSLAEIEEKTKRYAEAREALAEEVAALNAEIEAAKAARRKTIKRLVDRAADRCSALKLAILNDPEAFRSPKTMTINGIKVGFQKGRGGLLIGDEAQVVRLIRKHFPEEFDQLVKVTEKPVKGTLNNLTVSELKRIGVEVVETGDEVVIKPADSEVDKVVSALLKEAEAEEAA